MPLNQASYYCHILLNYCNVRLRAVVQYGKTTQGYRDVNDETIIKLYQ